MKQKKRERELDEKKKKLDEEKEENDRKILAMREREEFLNHQLELEQKKKKMTNIYKKKN